MYSLIELKTLVSSGRDPARSLPLRRGFLLIPLILVCFAFSPQMQAGLPPEIPGNPDGCYPNFTTAEGCNALHQLTGGLGNSAVGWYSNFLAGDASFNTSVGAGTLALTSGAGSNDNTALGTAAMILNLSGSDNTAVGTNALVFNTAATDNNGFGSFALYNNDSSGAGVATFNNAFGADALFSNVDGFGNNAFGESALFFNTIAAENTAVGDVALGNNDSSGSGLANNNVAVGGAALEFNVDGSENTAVGTGSGPNIILGFNNTYVGDFVGTLAPDESSTIRIGDLSNGNGAGSLACFIGGIFNNFQPVGGTVVEVTLDLADDELGWDVGPSNKGGTPPAAPRSAPGRRAAPTAPAQRPTSKKEAMLNDRVDKLQVVVQIQQKQITALTAQLKQQSTQIDKVSAQLEMLKPAPRVVENR
jgi:uncharacterized coiled-coil protein SlyX